MPRATSSRIASEVDSGAMGDVKAIRRLVSLGLTLRQAAIYVYVFKSVQEDGFQPSYKEIGELIDSSALAARGYVKRLEAAGWVKRHESGNRALRLMRTLEGGPFRGFTCR